MVIHHDLLLDTGISTNLLGVKVNCFVIPTNTSKPCIDNNGYTINH